MIQALLQPEAYPHPVAGLALIETHISWVLLTGTLAYKIKKSVDLGFVQTSSLEQRLHCCREELRLNRRLAPDLYEAVVPVVGPPECARILAEPWDSRDLESGSRLDVAVRMRQFDPQALLHHGLKLGVVNSAHLSDLAWELGLFHQHAALNDPTSDYGHPDSIIEPVVTNLNILEQLATSPSQTSQLSAHRAWVEQQQALLRCRFEARRQDGAIRECHGDLHCGNIRRTSKGRLEVFDAIDFSPKLRWIDPISEMAFLVMDLQTQGHTTEGLQVLNTWLECTGAYEGLDLWPWYFAYRAMVRAKVSALQADRCRDPQQRERLFEDLNRYLITAASCEPRPSGGLVLMHGLSGSGKSTLSQALIGPLHAVRIRSDRERHRAFSAMNQQPARFTGDRYRPEISTWLFHEHLPSLVRAALNSGYVVIVDATFLRKREREVMADCAQAMGRPWAIVSCRCSDKTAEERLRQRLRAGDDPSEADQAVRQQQSQWLEPLDAMEQARSVLAEESTSPAAVAEALRALIVQPQTPRNNP